ncbi:transcriptional repressor NrdR [bacterium]|nr:MAG: transcriptional repressor NrdR [bacterium]
MNCPYCDHSDTKVVDKRESDTTSTRRRRECLGCHQRFTTYERVELPDLMVVKHDGRRESFDLEKLKRGVQLAVTKRPVSEVQVLTMIDTVEAELRSGKRREVPAELIGALVMEKLKNIDHIAYIRFASVCRDFTQVEAFAEEVGELLDQPGKLV